MAKWDPDIHGVVFAKSAFTASSDRHRSHAGQARQRTSSAKQVTLSPWTKGSGWRPGMPVRLQQSTTSTTRSSEHSSSRILQPGVIRAMPEADSQSGIDAYMSQSKQVPGQAHAVPIEIDDSFDASSADATHGESLLAESSVEFVSHHDPQTAMLKYSALLYANAVEAARMPASRNKQLTTLSLPSTSAATLRPQLMHSTQALMQRCPMQFSRKASFSSLRDAEASDDAPAVDWDDPILAGKIDAAQMDFSDDDYVDSSLPIYDSTGRFAAPSRTLQPIAPSLRSNKVPPASPKTLVKGKADLFQTEMESLKAKAKEAALEARVAREEAKATQVAEWRRRFRTFSYDNGNWVIPKIWYFRGPDADFKSCDVRPGHAEPEPKPLEDVVASLKGPLGFDLEWNKLDWNDTFTRKVSPGPTGLFQIGDHDNVILYQLGQPRVLPDCLRAIMEDANIPKLGVSIKNDGRKLHTDFKVTPRGLLELSDLAKLVEPRLQQISHMISMQQLVAHFLERYLDKGEVRTSNWSKTLNDMQRKYAANDVFAALQLYKRMCGYAEVEQFTIDFAALLKDLHVNSKNDATYRTQRRQSDAKSRQAILAQPAGKPVRRTSVGGATVRQNEAWTLWHSDGLDRQEVAAKMGIKETTVSSYILKALHKETDYAFDPDRLRVLMRDAFMRREDEAAYAAVLLRSQQHPSATTFD